MAGVNFDLLRQGLEMLENLGIELAHSTSDANAPADIPAEQSKADRIPASAQQFAQEDSYMQPKAMQASASASKAELPEKKILRARATPALNARQLRRALILSEILAPPLALRRK